MKLDITPAAETLGLTPDDLARQVRQAFYGEEVQRIQRGRDDVRVMVRYPQDERQSLGNLENMRIRTRGGGEVPFRYVAHVEAGRSLSSIDVGRAARSAVPVSDRDPDRNHRHTARTRRSRPLTSCSSTSSRRLAR